jgi:hypothetical protein
MPPLPSERDRATNGRLDLEERAAAENERGESGEDNNDALHGKTSRFVY